MSASTQPFTDQILDFTYYVAPSVIGALVGVLVGGYFVQKYWMSRTNEAAFISYLIQELDDLVDDALEYWSLDCSGGDTVRDKEARDSARMLEQRIKGSSHNLNSVLAEYAQRYCRDVNFTSLMADVHDACTGGTFEQTRRAPDRGRYLKIINTVHLIRSHLFKRRV